MHPPILSDHLRHPAPQFPSKHKGLFGWLVCWSESLTFYLTKVCVSSDPWPYDRGSGLCCILINLWTYQRCWRSRQYFNCARFLSVPPVEMRVSPWGSEWQTLLNSYSCYIGNNPVKKLDLWPFKGTNSLCSKLFCSHLQIRHFSFNSKSDIV